MRLFTVVESSRRVGFVNSDRECPQMSKFSKVLFMSVLALGVAACSTAPAKVEKTAACMFPDSDNAAPPWVCGAPVEGMAAGAVGSAARSDAGVAFMKQIAVNDARVQLAQTMKAQVQNMIRQYAEASGAGSKVTLGRVYTSVTRQITDQTLYGSRIFKSIVAPDGEMFVLVGLDETGVQSLAETAIKTSMNNDQAVWKQFKTQKNQDELAAEIAKQKIGNAAESTSAGH
jgi:LPP20 lipoprotein